MNKLALLIAVPIIVGIALIGILIFQNLNQTHLEISEFKLSNNWENSGGLEVDLPFNITLHNTGTIPIQKLEIVIEMFENNNSVRIDTVFSENEHFNGTLQTGEIREINGLIRSTVNATSIMFPIGGTSETFTYLAKVTLNGALLDDYWAYTNITNNVNILAFNFTGGWWPGPAFPMAVAGTNITLQNLETDDLNGLSLEIKMYDANLNQIQTELEFYNNNNTQIETFDGILHTGETRTIRAAIISDWHSVNDSPRPFTTIATIKLGNETLDEWKITA